MASSEEAVDEMCGSEPLDGWSAGAGLAGAGGAMDPVLGGGGGESHDSGRRALGMTMFQFHHDLKDQVIGNGMLLTQSLYTRS